ncbi:MAG TPA: hypothetical protein ACQGQJ_01960 [Xylella fastidiosa subsp. multiplex]
MIELTIVGMDAQTTKNSKIISDQHSSIPKVTSITDCLQHGNMAAQFPITHFFSLAIHAFGSRVTVCGNT